MHETTDDLAELQQVIDASIERAGPFLRHSFQMPARSLAAAEVAAAFEGLPTVALAITTADGRPRVSPIACLMFRGRLYIPTARESARYRFVRRRPAVALTLFRGVDLAVIVNGRARPIAPGEPLFGELHDLHVQLGGQSVRTWGPPERRLTGVFLEITPEDIWSYRREVVV